MTDPKPHKRNTVGPVRVTYRGAAGDVVVEVIREEWLNPSTGRYRRKFSARELGALGWHMSSSARLAIRHALYLGRRQAPALSSAAAKATRALEEAGR